MIIDKFAQIIINTFLGITGTKIARFLPRCILYLCCVEIEMFFLILKHLPAKILVKTNYA